MALSSFFFFNLIWWIGNTISLIFNWACFWVICLIITLLAPNLNLSVVDISITKCPKPSFWYLFPKLLFWEVAPSWLVSVIIFSVCQGQTFGIIFHTSHTLSPQILASLLRKYSQYAFNLFSLPSLPPPVPSHPYFLLSYDRSP